MCVCVFCNVCVCVYMYAFCNVCVCVFVGFVMWDICMCGLCNVWVFVCVIFVMCGFLYVCFF